MFAAAAALDPHYIVEGVSIGAVEVELHGVGEGRGTAAAIGASPAGTKAISSRCRASIKGDADWFAWTEGSLAFLLLQDDRESQLNKLNNKPCTLLPAFYVYTWMFILPTLLSLGSRSSQ